MNGHTRYYHWKNRHDLGEEVKRLRLAAGLTAAKLGEKSQTCELTVIRLEHGNNVGLVQFLAILEALKAELTIKAQEAQP